MMIRQKFDNYVLSDITNTLDAYVTSDIAKALRELGFNLDITTFYHRVWDGDGNDDSTPTDDFILLDNHNYSHDWNHSPLTYAEGYDNLLNEISAPRLDTVIKWLREVKRFHVEIMYSSSGQCYDIAYCDESIYGDGHMHKFNIENYKTFEEAQANGVVNAIKMIKQHEQM